METKMIRSNMYLDPLTGLNNFFSFINADFNDIFKLWGLVLIVDIADFEKFNVNFGRDAGDMCIRDLSDALKDIFSNYNGAWIFRTHGDEFTIIFPNGYHSNVEEICSKIKILFNSVMNQRGFAGMSLNSLIMPYNSPVDSVEKFYELVLENSYIEAQESEDKSKRERLLKHIIRGFISRVRDTLTRYNDAFDLAVTDDISGLSNHRAGRAYLEDLLEEYKSKSSEFSILFIDGDGLRRYNTISYEAGNDIIKKLSDIITCSKRRGDRVYRWLSGDEFLVVLKDTEADNAVKLAERMRRAVEENTADLIYPVTISIGVASYPEDGRSINDIISKAERANSMAKSLGKNRVIKYS